MATLNPSSITRRLEAAGVDVLRSSAADVEHRNEPTPAEPWRVVEHIGAVVVLLSRGGLETIDTDAAARVAVAALAAAGLAAELTADSWPTLRVTAPAADVVDLDDEPAPAAVPLVVVPCGRAKLDHAAPAGRLYVGGLHRLARQAAETIAAGIGGRVVILSALHGLVDLAQELEPYDVTIGDADAIEPARLAAQLAELAPSRVVALTPNAYTAALLAAADAHAVPLVAPLAGSRGLPEQRGRLAALRDGRRDVDAPPTPAAPLEPLALFAV